MNSLLHLQNDVKSICSTQKNFKKILIYVVFLYCEFLQYTLVESEMH